MTKRWVATQIEMGCDCCSYVAFDTGTGEIPVEYLNDSNIEVEWEEEEDDDVEGGEG